MRIFIPWYIRFYLKIILSHIPSIYLLLAKFKLGRHGKMDTAEYSKRVFEDHFVKFRTFRKGEDTFSGIVELGCGDSVASGFYAKAKGFQKIYLIDSGAFENAELSFYLSLCQEELGSSPVVSSKDELLRSLGISYLTNGLKSLQSIPSNSVDLIFSQAVLEHIPKEQFEDFALESFRVLKTGGVISHTIDLKDHMESSLNSLRFSKFFWESWLVRKTLAYTNRLRHGEIIHVFKKAGFSITLEEVDEWPKLPLDKSKLHREFLKFSDEELKICDMRIVAVKN